MYGAFPLPSLFGTLEPECVPQWVSEGSTKDSEQSKEVVGMMPLNHTLRCDSTTYAQAT